MAGFSITGQMKVATLQKSFLKEFGLTLRIYQGRSFADPTQTLAQVRKTKGTGKALAVAKNMKVGNLEDKFEAEFGLKVQVAGSDDSYLCDNDLTLNAAQQEDDKKLARKERKAARQTDESSELAGPEWVPMTDFTALRFGLTDDDSSEDFIENINPSANIHVAIAHKQGDDFLCILVDGQFLAIQDGDVDDLMTKVPRALKDMAGQELAEGFVKAAYEQDADGLVDIDEDLEEEFFAADEAEEVIWYSPCLFAVGSTTEDCEAEIDMHSGRVRDLSDGSIQDDLSMFFGRRDEDETWVVGLHR